MVTLTEVRGLVRVRHTIYLRPWPMVEDLLRLLVLLSHRRKSKHHEVLLACRKTGNPRRLLISRRNALSVRIGPRQPWFLEHSLMVEHQILVLIIRVRIQVLQPEFRTDGRVVEYTGLENRHTSNGIGGSNPSLSAIIIKETWVSGLNQHTTNMPKQ